MAKKPHTNPFKPTAGAEPPVLVGRQQVIDDFMDGLDEGVGAPGRLMRITGPRGSGKTVLMTEIGDIAKKRNWVVVRESARGNLVGHIISKLASSMPSANASADADFGILKLHAGINENRDIPIDLENVLNSASKKIGKDGLLITIDEVQNAARPDMEEIANAVQFLIQGKKDIALVFAGITTGVADLINDEGLTFLRRAKPEELAPIPTEDVMSAFLKSFQETGLTINEPELRAAAEVTHGYAFLIQLIGYYIWRNCRRHLNESNVVTTEDVKDGIELANSEHICMNMMPALRKLTERPIRYLIAMAEDDGPSATGDVAKRMGQSAQSLSSARQKLISEQVIEGEVRGYVDFSIPYMRECIRDNAESLLAKFNKEGD